MKLRYRLFRRGNGILFIEDRTWDKTAAQRILNARNEALQSYLSGVHSFSNASKTASRRVVQEYWWSTVRGCDEFAGGLTEVL